MARRLVRHERRSRSAPGPSSTLAHGLLARRQRQPRLPRPRRHRPRHVRPHRLGLRGLGPRGRGPRRAPSARRPTRRRSAPASPCGSSTPRRASATRSACAGGPGALRADVTVFQTDVDDNVAKQSLDPARRAPSARASPASRSCASSTAASCTWRRRRSPVLVRANFGDARLRGIEGSVEVPLGGALHARPRRHRDPRRGPRDGPAAEHRGRYARAGAAGSGVRFAPGGGKRFWVEPYLHAAPRQERLSTLDLEDRRTGRDRARARASRASSRTARGPAASSRPGPDGVAGQRRRRARWPTGETLAEVQARVLGPAAPPRRSSPRCPATWPSACAAACASARATRCCSTSTTSATATTAASRGASTRPGAGSSSATRPGSEPGRGAPLPARIPPAYSLDEGRRPARAARARAAVAATRRAVRARGAAGAARAGSPTRRS